MKKSIKAVKIYTLWNDNSVIGGPTQDKSKLITQQNELTKKILDFNSILENLKKEVDLTNKKLKKHCSFINHRYIKIQLPMIEKNGSILRNKYVTFSNIHIKEERIK